MDAIIKLAEAIELKYREKYFGNFDNGYLKQDWFIQQIVKLLKKYPQLIELIDIDNMSIEMIIALINNFISREIEKRELKLQKLRFILTEKWQCRSQETLILLLLLGYCFHKSVVRMKNNRVSEGGYFKPYEAENVISHVAYPMPPQSRNDLLDQIINLVTESSCSTKDIEKKVADLDKNTSKPEKNDIFFANKNCKYKH